MGHGRLVSHSTEVDGPKTLEYFNNGFSSRIRLRNTGAYEEPHEPSPMNWRRNDLIFLSKLAPIPPAHWPSSALGNDLFFWKSPPLPRVLMLIPATLSSSHHRRDQSGPQKYVTSLKWATAHEMIGNKLGHKDFWLPEIDHGTKKVENHWFKLYFN